MAAIRQVIYTAAQVNGIYEAVLQRAPSSIEVTAALALDSATGDAATVAAIVDSAEAITNVYPILQSFELAFGYLPQAATLASMVQSALSVTQLCSAIVASQTFANVYDGGTMINPNSPVTASIVETLYTHALGHAPTSIDTFRLAKCWFDGSPGVPGHGYVAVILSDYAVDY